MKRLEMRIAAAAVAACAAAAPPALALVPEHEIDVAGSVGPVSLVYGDHTLNAALATGQEVDRYTFTGQSGDGIRILARSLSGFVDPVITLRDAGGAVLATAVCDSGVGCASTFLDHTLAASGLYTVNVAENGVNEAGSYQIGLERYPPVNNWVGFRYSTPVDDTFQYRVDMDFHAFTGVAGSEVRVSAASFTGFVDPVVTVWDPTGAAVATFVCDSGVGCAGAFVDFDITKNGSYRVSIHDNGLDETGNYRLQVDCLFGACPSPLDPAPLPVPEPATWAMALCGIAVFGLRRFRARRGGPGRVRSTRTAP
jgi:hypothetical protein